MRILALIALGLAPYAVGAATGLRLDKAPLPPEMGASQHYVGTALVHGTYLETEVGELCFIPSTDSIKRLITVPSRGQVCFSNEEQATRLLGAAAAIEAIDAEYVCSMEGPATILVSGLWVGHGPAAMWYTTELVRVVEHEAPRLIKCGG
jgi:hypothetical protein